MKIGAREKCQYVINHNDQALGGVVVGLKVNLIKNISTRLFTIVKMKDSDEM